MYSNIGVVLSNTINNTLFSVVNYIPRLISGLIVILLGVIIASFLKQILLEIFKLLKLDSILKKYGVPESKEGIQWGNILSELLRWFIIVLFLVPAADVWGLQRFVEVLNSILLFLPNVFVAVLLLLVGFVIARLAYEMIYVSLNKIIPDSAKTISIAGKWIIMVFVFLVVLNQLGIATDLIKILFSGFVAMLALAGGLSFGLGGKDTAKQILEKIFKSKSK